MSDGLGLDLGNEPRNAFRLSVYRTHWKISQGATQQTLPTIRGEATDAQEFECVNVDCGKTSPVRDVEWYDGKDVIECPHCWQWHELRRLQSFPGTPLSFMVMGLIKSK